MSKIKLKANESGTGILTIEAPNTDTDKTLTLPTSDGTLVTTDGTTFTGNVNFGDNDKAIFGAGSDLQIYHDGSFSYITDAGTGDLRISANNLRMQNADNTANYIKANNGSNVELFFNNAAKLATTSTGIDVTGTITADGLTVADASAVIVLQDTSSGGPAPYHRLSTGLNSSAESVLNFSRSADGSSYSTSMTIDGDGNVGIGTSSPAQKLHIDSATNTRLRISTTNTGSVPEIQLYNAAKEWKIGVETSTDAGGGAYSNSGASYLTFRNQTDTTTALAISPEGRVTMPYQPMFHVYGSGANSIYGTSSPVVTFNSVIENTGSHYNDTTYRFTAPVDGNYYFSSMVRLDGANTGYFRSQIRKNGSNNYVWGHQINDYGSWSPSYATFSGSVVYKLSANDYVEVVIESNTDTSWTLYRTESSFYGILLS